jgi:hypothetical protein
MACLAAYGQLKNNKEAVPTKGIILSYGNFISPTLQPLAHYNINIHICNAYGERRRD